MRLLAVFLALMVSPLVAAVYPWAAPVPAPAEGTDPGARAYLWIPPDCHRVRAVVVGQHNMIEEGIFADPGFRRTLAELGFALVWITPSADAVFRFDQDAVARFTATLAALGEVSGYSEIARAPVVPVGHSAHASFPWNFAAALPGRTLAILSVKGDAPLTNLTGSGRPNPVWGDRGIDGIPGLMVMGQFEWWLDRLAPASAFRAAHPAAPLAVLCDVGHGHFDFNPQLIGHLGLFLRKAALARLPAVFPAAPDAPIVLTPLDARDGWLVDQWRADGPRRAPAAPYADYAGERAAAFWAFDAEHARAIESHHDQHGRAPQLLGFRDPGSATGAFIAQTRTHYQVLIPFRPSADDGVSFRVEAGFIDTVPEGNPEKWSGLPAGSAITHASGGGPVRIERITGPFAATGDGAFEVTFDRSSEAGSGRSHQDLWLMALHGGDASHASAVQQALIRIPTRNREGAPQTISFPPIADQPAATPRLRLAATSDSGLPVRYYVRHGPAFVEGDTLVFTPLPPRTRYPVEVTVVAWQYGRAASPSEPAIQGAEPVECVFYLR